MAFLIISIIIFLIIIYKMNKRISYLEMYATSFFAIILQLLTDIFLEFKYELYGYFKPGVDYETLLVIFILYPVVNIIFLNFYPYQKNIIKKTVYFLGWTLFALFYEWLSVKTGFFYYDGWKLWYSIPIYPLIFFVVLVNIHINRKLLKHQKENS